MQRLVRERILTAVPGAGRGLRVSTLGAEHVADLYLARAAVERKVTRPLAARRDRELLDALAVGHGESAVRALCTQFDEAPACFTGCFTGERVVDTVEALPRVESVS